MKVLRTFFAILVLFLFCLPTAWGQVDQSKKKEVSRINWIQSVLDEGRKPSMYWQYGWTGIYGASVVLEVANAIEKDKPDEEDEQFDSTVNAINSLIGFGCMVFDPLISYSAADKLRKMPESNFVEKKEKIIAAEKLLRACAKREERGRSWQTHALAGVVSLLAGIAVACDDSREDDGLAMFASSMVVAEIQIFTMPTTAIEDLKNYRNQKFAKIQKNKPNRLFVTAIPGGLKFKYLF